MVDKNEEYIELDVSHLYAREMGAENVILCGSFGCLIKEGYNWKRINSKSK